jgi:hypothetical protein
MLFGELPFVLRIIKNMKIFCVLNEQIVNVVAGGAYRYHSALKS